MNQKEEMFRKGLAEIRKKAAGNFNHITVEEIVKSFPKMELTKKQIDMIHQYLKEEHIILEEYHTHDTRSVTVGSGPEKLTGEEKAYFQMYLDDLAAIPELTEEEDRILTGHLLSGDESAQNRLIEGNLHRVLAMARRRAGNGVLIGDLVQEGNMTLITAIEEYRGAGVRMQGGSLAAFLENRVDEALKALIAEQGGFDHTAEKLAREANRLLRITKEFEEEFGREASLAELAEEMQMTEDEVEAVMRTSYSAMEIGDSADGAPSQEN